MWSRLISRIKSSCFLINLQIGIGVLALPNTLHAIGMIPGIICILASGLITTYLDTVIGAFKRGHPEVYSIADTGYVMFGRFGKELFGGMYWVIYTTPVTIARN
jgi:amino acid permease